MRLLDRLKEKTRGVLTSVAPQAGTPPAAADEVKRRLLAISGKGIQTAEHEGAIVVSWSAKVSSAGPGGADYEYLYRALRIELDPERTTASGICAKTSTTAEADLGGFGISKQWFRGQEIGFEDLYVVAWLGPHRTEGGADEGGYRFSWKQLRDPVIEAVTGAGWTYRPRKL